MRAALALLAACLLGCTAAAASAACEGGSALPAFAGKPVTLAQDTLFFRTAAVQLDIDGSPAAYGVRDQGLEDICNGLGPLEPPACRGKVRGECYAACQAAFRRWNGDPARLGDTMCSIGLGGGNCGTPDARLQAAPRQDFFVSETSVRLKPPAGTALSSWIRSEPAQLDSLAVPYFVIPGGFRRLPWDATPGDVGVILQHPGGTPVPFVVGDVGGALDEGSARLLAQLRGVDALPRARKANAFGQQVDRLQGARAGDFRVAIFRHTAPFASAQHRKALVLDKSAGELADFIRETAAQRLQAIGGAQRIVACTGP